jgi:hypothetical protein
LNPRLCSNLRWLIASLVATGHLDEARYYAQTLLEVNPGFCLSAYANWCPLKEDLLRALGNRAEFRKVHRRRSHRDPRLRAWRLGRWSRRLGIRWRLRPAGRERRGQTDAGHPASTAGSGRGRGNPLHREERIGVVTILPQLDFIQEFGFVLRGLQPKIDQSCIATILLLPHQRPESQLYAGIAPAVHNGPWSVIASPLATGLLRISVAPSA